MRVEPAIASGPVATRIACSAAVSKGASGLLAMPIVSAPRARAALDAGEGERRGAAGREADRHVLRPDPMAAIAASPRSRRSSAFSIARVKAASPPAISSTSRSSGQSKVGGSSAPSCTPMRPDEPAPA